jgi:hypothetical protein
MSVCRRALYRHPFREGSVDRIDRLLLLNPERVRLILGRDHTGKIRRDVER